MTSPLSGIRVLDLTRLLPGAVCTLMLADMGAEVIKVEQPDIGDYLRWYLPRVGDYAAAFHALNRNKKSITLNLKHPQASTVLQSLVAGADVLIENFRPQVARRLGLGYSSLQAINPRLVLCSLSGFGQAGPFANTAGHDLNFAGLTGVLAAGDGGVLPVQTMDFGGAYLAAFAIVTALFQRERSGSGTAIDAALLDAGISLMTLARAESFARAAPPLPAGELLSGGYACYRSYLTADGGRITLAALEDKFWIRFCQVVGREDLANKVYLAPDLQATLIPQLEALFLTKSAAEWTALLSEVDACAMPIYDVMEAADHEALQARGALYEAEGVAHTRTPFLMGSPVAHQPAPALGADSDAQLAAIGYDPETVATLRAQGVI